MIHKANIYSIELNQDSLQTEAKKYHHNRKKQTNYITESLSNESVNKTIELIKKKLNLTEDKESNQQNELLILILITGLMQKGGSNKIAGNAINFTYNNKTLTNKELQTVLKSVQKNATNRQLARLLADEIADISIAFELEGDLANQMRMEYPDLSPDEACWCSNFQTTNERCPKKVRNWLVNNYRNRFNR